MKKVQTRIAFSWAEITEWAGVVGRSGLLGFVNRAFDEDPLALVLVAVLIQVLEIAPGARGQDTVTNGLGPWSYRRTFRSLMDSWKSSVSSSAEKELLVNGRAGHRRRSARSSTI